MKIRRIEIQGFKSFADRTQLRFGEGITGVVGPNGCGKSNIVDAIRWVMGEQSAKHLRGGAMQDVIFAGSESRGPSGFAQVTITFKNDGKLVPPEYQRCEEIGVTRRLFRDGTSEYEINKVACRLRDILDLFMGTGIGKNAYSIIEQGRIGLIVTAKPEDRRAFLEDAAGVSRYKARRKQAERRIEATEQNLLRVADITDELEKRRATLEKQADKAERYTRIKNDLRTLEFHGASHRFLELETIARHAAQEIAAIRETIDREKNAIEVDEERIAVALEDLASREDAVRKREVTVHEHQQALALCRNNAEFLGREREKLATRQSEATHELDELGAQDTHLRAEGTEARALAESLDASGGRESQALEACKGDLALLNRQIEEERRILEREKQALVQTLTAIARHKSNLANLERSSKDLELRIERSRKMEAEAVERHATASAKSIEIRDSLASNRQMKLSLEDRRSEHESLLERLRGEHQESEVSLLSTREELMDKRSRLNSLLEIRRNYEGCKEAVRSIMQQKEQDPALESSLHGLVADVVSSAPRYETAIEAVLGDRLQSVIVATQSDGVASIEFLKQRDRGRSSFIPLDLREDHVSWAPRASSSPPRGSASTGDASAAPVMHSGPPPAFAAAGSGLAAEVVRPTSGDTLPPCMLPVPEIADSFIFSEGELWPPLDAPGVCGKMVDLVEARPGYEQVARVLLGDVVVVEELEQARKLWRENGHRKTLVTLAGDVLDPVGVLTGGSSEGVSAGMLARKREIAELETSVRALETTVATLEHGHAGLETRIDEIEQTLRDITKDAHREELAIVGHERAIEKLDAEMMREEREQKTAATELAHVVERSEEAAREAKEAEAALAELETTRIACEEVVRAKTEALEAQREAARAMSAEATRLEVEVVSRAERRESAIRNAERIEKRLVEIANRRRRLEELLSESAAESERIAEKIADAEREGVSLEQVLLEERDVVRIAREELEAELRAQKAEETSIRARRKQYEALEIEANDRRIRHRELEIERETLVTRIDERYHVQLVDIVSDYHLAPLQTDAHRSQTEKLRRQIDNFGPINLTAIDEFKEVDERFQFLSAQRKDLEDAIASLQTAIKRINKTSKERYLEAFRLVNEKFQQVFPRLFNGGNASLVMLDESDPLESGIEVFAQPPGKKLQSIMLLSGGEKALTAVALIFSIFLIKPTPFCLLDEVDAPLDDANVGRYNDLVRDMSSISQFILITHNKRTMELPDRLYGVTMEEAGISKIVPVDIVGSDKRPLEIAS